MSYTSIIDNGRTASDGESPVFAREELDQPKARDDDDQCEAVIELRPRESAGVGCFVDPETGDRQNRESPQREPDGAADHREGPAGMTDEAQRKTQ